MKFKKILALSLAAALLTAVFTGCGSTDLADYVESYITPEPQATADTEAAGFDYDAAYAAFEPDTVMLTVNGDDVLWSEYFYWLYNSVWAIESGAGADIDWDSEYTGGMSFREVAYADAMDYVKLYHGVEAGAKELNVTIDEEDEASMAEAMEADIEYYSSGDEAAFWEYLEGIYISKDLYNYMNKANILYQKTYEAMYGERGEKCPDEDVKAEAENEGYMQAKHILLKTVDDEGNSLSDEEIAGKKEQAEQILGMLEASDDPEALFDELIETYGEDEGQADFPNGYLFAPGDMVESFENAVLELSDHEYSGVVESSFGYHIILRLPIDLDSVPMAYYSTYGGEYTLRYYMAWEIFDSVLNGWEDNLEIKYSEAYENMDLSSIFHV